jgi:hypothetical protein
MAYNPNRVLSTQTDTLHKLLRDKYENDETGYTIVKQLKAGGAKTEISKISNANVIPAQHMCTIVMRNEKGSDLKKGDVLFAASKCAGLNGIEIVSFNLLREDPSIMPDLFAIFKPELSDKSRFQKGYEMGRSPVVEAPSPPPVDSATARIRALEADIESMRPFVDYAKIIMEVPRPNVD